MGNVAEATNKKSSFQQYAETWVEQYAAKRKKLQGTQAHLFDSHEGLDELGAGRWITIGAEQHGDGEHHGGHHVFIGDDGKMKTGAFAGKTMQEAFGKSALNDPKYHEKPKQPEEPPKPVITKSPEEYMQELRAIQIPQAEGWHSVDPKEMKAAKDKAESIAREAMDAHPEHANRFFNYVNSYFPLVDAKEPEEPLPNPFRQWPVSQKILRDKAKQKPDYGKRLEGMETRKDPDGMAKKDEQPKAKPQLFEPKLANAEPPQLQPSPPSPGIEMPSQTKPIEEAAAGDQLGLFGEAFKAPSRKPTMKVDDPTRGKQMGLFDTKGNANQMDLFGDGVMPEDLVYKPEGKKDVDADSIANMAPGAIKRSERERAASEEGLNQAEENRRWAENHITIAADDISKLRKQDVYRVLDNAPNDKRGYLENWIQKKRPDLAEQVNLDSQEIDEERAAAKEKKSQPKPFEPVLDQKKSDDVGEKADEHGVYPSVRKDGIAKHEEMIRQNRDRLRQANAMDAAGIKQAYGFRATKSRVISNIERDIRESQQFIEAQKKHLADHEDKQSKAAEQEQAKPESELSAQDDTFLNEITGGEKPFDAKATIDEMRSAGKSLVAFAKEKNLTPEQRKAAFDEFARQNEEARQPKPPSPARAAAMEKAKARGMFEPVLSGPAETIPLRERKTVAAQLANDGKQHSEIVEHLTKRGVANVDAKKLAADALGDLADRKSVEPKTSEPAKPEPATEPQPEAIPIDPPKPPAAAITPTAKATNVHSSILENGGTPREAAKAAQKELDADYEFARASTVRNAGEDLKGSARHKVNLWKSLEDAEKNGTAEAMVKRDELLKNEPHDLMAHAHKNAATALAMHFAMRSFPAKPGTVNKSKAASDREAYLEAYRDIKKKAEELAQKHEDPIKAIGELQLHVRSMIEKKRVGDRANSTANDLVGMHNALKTGYFAPKTGPAARTQEFLDSVASKYGEDWEKNESIADSVISHAHDIMEGKSMNATFGKESKAQKRFDPSEAYVKHASRKGGRDVADVTSDPNKATKHMVESFGIRGVQWGNTVSDEERKHHAAKAVESLVDLADVVGLHPKDIALDGKLGLAFGARGKGNASAHYEPSTQVINLTRASGVGTLAHEWGHAFDHMLTDFGSSRKDMDSGRASGDFMSGEHDNTHHLIDPSGRKWNSRGDESRLREGWKLEERPKKGIREAYQKWSKASGDYRKRLKSALRDAVRSGQMSQKKADDYWNSDHEIFARTFERHVQHKLHEEGRENTYLSGFGGDHPLWPTKEEAAVMAPAFDSIFEEYRKHKHGSSEKVKFSSKEAQDVITSMLFEPSLSDSYEHLLVQYALLDDELTLDRYEWVEAMHPREPAGRPTGGQFTHQQSGGNATRRMTLADLGKTPAPASSGGRQQSRIVQTAPGVFEAFPLSDEERNLMRAGMPLPTHPKHMSMQQSAQKPAEPAKAPQEPPKKKEYGNTRKRELPESPELQSHHSLHHDNQSVETQLRLRDYFKRFRGLMTEAVRKGGDASEEAIWANIDKHALKGLLDSANAENRKSIQQGGNRLDDLFNANQIIPRMIAERLDGGSRFFDPTALRGRWHEPEPTQDQPSQDDSSFEPGAFEDDGSGFAPSTGEHVPGPIEAHPDEAKLSAIKRNRLTAAIKSVVGDNQEYVDAFKPYVFEAHKLIAQEVAEHNSALDNVFGATANRVSDTFSSNGMKSGRTKAWLSALIRKARARMLDPAKQKGFDEWMDVMNRNYPHMLAGGGEQAMMDLLEQGRRKVPDILDGSVFERAVALAGPSFIPQEDSSEAPTTNEEFEQVPFSLLGAAHMVQMYRYQNWIARERYVNLSEAQIRAGNYKKKHLSFHGFKISLETKKGERRRPQWPPMPCDYGDIKGTEGSDGDAVDVFVGPDLDSELVVVVDQVTKDGKFDEHKVLLGFTNEQEATATYLKAYTDDWVLGPVTTMTIKQFTTWLKEGNTKKQVSKQVSRYSSLFSPVLESVSEIAIA